MPFGCLLDSFWVSFGCLLGAFWRPLDVPGVHFGEFVNFNDFGNVSATEQPSNLDTILVFVASMVAVSFLSFFWVRQFLTFCSFGVHVRSNSGAFLGYLGTLKIGLKR